jgi:D-glycero-D-manno-heptose 1,7-bisphosphate phosphatase
MANRPVVFFDRDGTLNELASRDTSRGPRTCAELKIVAAAAPSIKALHAAGFLTCVVTNQPDLARGLLTDGENRCIEERIWEALPELDAYLVCPHDNFENCPCRKPKPGLLLRFAEEVGARPDQSWMVGDKWTDVLAGKNAGVRTILIANARSHDETSQGKKPVGLAPDFEVDSLGSAVKIILGTEP